MNNEISVVDSHKIDRAKWNQCVDKSSNGLIYALTDYLDHMTEQWTGIVINDYEAVLPVPWKKKFGIKYVYSVPFIQQLGFFSAHEGKIDEKIFQAIFSICRYGEYYFNYANVVPGSVARINYVLPLSKTLDDTIAAFSNDGQRNIKRSLSKGLKYHDAAPDEVIDAFQALYGSLCAVRDYRNFAHLCQTLLVQDRIVSRKVTVNGEKTLAAILLLKYRDRLYNVMNATLPEGRSVEANYFLLANVWKEFESSNLVFDFEGSELPGVKEFYEKFSPKNEPYFSFRFNYLKFPANIFKK